MPMPASAHDAAAARRNPERDESTSTDAGSRFLQPSKNSCGRLVELRRGTIPVQALRRKGGVHYRHRGNPLAESWFSASLQLPSGGDPPIAVEAPTTEFAPFSR